MKLGVAFAVAAVLVPSPAADQQLPQFQATVLGVSVPVSVWRDRRPVTDLAAVDFELMDHGVPQDITVVDAAAVPLDITLVVQETERVERFEIRSFAAEINTAAGALRPEDQLRVLFAGDDQREQKLPVLVDPMERALLEGRCQPIYDALVRAFIRPTSPERRRAIITISAREGSGSFHSFELVRDIARLSNATLYAANIERDVGKTTHRNHISTSTCTSLEVDWSPSRQSALGKIAQTPSGFRQWAQLWRFGQDRLTELAKETGGREIRPAVLTNSITGPLREAIDELRAGYVLRYSPKAVAEGGWHELRVAIKRPGSYDLRMRPGYQR